MVMALPSLAQYAAWWKAMKIEAAKLPTIKYIASRILENKQRYIAVARNLGLPWFFVAVLHYRESALNFHCHLHNGDPLNARTTHVPAGRPAAPAEPPFSWEESALDALRGRRIPPITTVEEFAYAAEGYNGPGYAERGVSSDYLWAWTSEHEAGRFVADHKYDPQAASKQSGVMPLLAVLQSMDASVHLNTSEPPPKPAQVLKRPWWTRLLSLLSTIFLTLLHVKHI